jgi:3-methyladenine DNA glycosylase/8-oxoguanine DNA glycosylase
MQSPRELHLEAMLTLAPKPPFNFDASLHKPDHFPSADNAWEPGTRWQTLLWEQQPLGLKFTDLGAAGSVGSDPGSADEAPRLSLSVYSREKLDQGSLGRLAAEVNYRYNLQLDLSAFNRRFQKDPQLGPIIQRWLGMRPLNCGSLYEYLIIAILLQNATVRRSVQMMQALFENYGTRLSYDGKSLYCFWEPQAMQAASEQDLRGLKVGYRARSIKRVSEAIASGAIDEMALRSKSREEQRQALLALYGIGPASVGYILFDVFHHLDEMEHISPWEQKIYSRLFFEADLGEPLPVERLLAHFEARFGGYRMLAVHYVWEDLFWRRKHEPVPWLETIIRL